MNDINQQLHDAIIAHDVQQVQSLIAQGADIHTEIEEGGDSDDKCAMPALHRAVANRAPLSIVEMLLVAGAQVNDKCEAIAPLHLAAENNQLEVCQLLLDSGAQVNIRTGDGETPLHLAAYDGYEPMCRLLLEHGADIHATQAVKETPLHAGAQSNQPAVCRLLVEWGAALEVLSDTNATPLGLAAQYGHAQSCRELVALGANPSFVPSPVKYSNYLTPFQAAVANAHLELIQYFTLECGVTLQQQTLEGIALADLPLNAKKRQVVRECLLSIESELAVRCALQSDDVDGSLVIARKPAGGLCL